MIFTPMMAIKSY